MRKQLCVLFAFTLALGVGRWSLADDEASGKKVDRAVDNASNKVDRATDKVGDTARDAANKTRDKIGAIDAKTEKSPGQTADLPAGIQKATRDDAEDIPASLADLREEVMSKSLHRVRNKL